MSYWIVHILRFSLINDLPACHIGALKIKKSSLGHSTITPPFGEFTFNETSLAMRCETASTC